MERARFVRELASGEWTMSELCEHRLEGKRTALRAERIGNVQRDLVGAADSYCPVAVRIELFDVDLETDLSAFLVAKRPETIDLRPDGRRIDGLRTSRVCTNEKVVAHGCPVLRLLSTAARAWVGAVERRLGQP
jgi:hypothetical protein